MRNWKSSDVILESPVGRSKNVFISEYLPSYGIKVKHLRCFSCKGDWCFDLLDFVVVFRLGSLDLCMDWVFSSFKLDKYRRLMLIWSDQNFFPMCKQFSSLFFVVLSTILLISSDSEKTSNLSKLFETFSPRNRKTSKNVF